MSLTRFDAQHGWGIGLGDCDGAQPRKMVGRRGDRRFSLGRGDVDGSWVSDDDLGSQSLSKNVKKWVPMSTMSSLG